MGKILITGAGGFTGRHLAAELAANGHDCVGILFHAAERTGAAPMHEHVADLLDARQLTELMARVQPDFVVHLAAISFVGHGSVDEIYRTNVLGTRNLLEAIAALPAPPRMTLLASSANVYGNAQADPITEDAPPAPANDYAVSKLAMEHVAKLYAARLPLVLMRPFNYTGVGQSENFLIPKIVAHAVRRASVIELGNLDVARDFSDVRTVVECYRRVLETPSAAGRTLNVCSGRAYSLREVLTLVEQLSGHRMEVRVNAALARGNEVRVLRGSRERLEKTVGSLTSIGLAETLRWMLEDGTAAR